MREAERVKRLAGCVVWALAAAACAGSSSSRSAPATPHPVSAAPSRSTPAAPSAAPSPLWRVGASPLPLRPDGFGQVLPTPTVLRDRRLPTVDRLPPPPGGRFTSTTGPLTPTIRRRMGESLSPGCPVRARDLRYLTVSFRGFDGRPHTGELVVAARVARQVVGVFGRLYAAGFPIEEMRLPGTADLRAAPTGDGNDTAGFVCRAARGQTRFSAHAYGVAIDLNPFQNPEVKRDLVLPELASAYTDRSWRRPGMIGAGSLPVRAFAAIGWSWGGDWRSSKDWMHFSLTGT